MMETWIKMFFLKAAEYTFTRVMLYQSAYLTSHNYHDFDHYLPVCIIIKLINNSVIIAEGG